MVAIKARCLPLVSDGEIQVTVAIDIGCGNAPRDLLLARAHEIGDVIEPSTLRTDEQWVAFVTTQVITDMKPMPGLRTVKQYIVAHRDFVQLWPAVDVAANEPCGLNRFQHAVVVKVR